MLDAVPPRPGTETPSTLAEHGPLRGPAPPLVNPPLVALALVVLFLVLLLVAVLLTGDGGPVSADDAMAEAANVPLGAPWL